MAADPPPTSSISHRLLIGTIWMVLWRITTRGLGLISTLVLARLLAPSDFGLIAMATAFAASVEALSQLGVQDALVRERENDRSLLNTAFTLQLLRGVLTALLLVAIAPWAAGWFEEPRLAPVIQVMAIAALLAGMENIGVVEFRRRLQAREEVVLMLVPRIAQVVVGVGLAVALRSYWALPLSLVAMRATRVAMTYLRHPYRPGLSLRRWRDLAGFSAWSWAASITRTLWDRMDVFILGPVFGPRAVGYYLMGREVALLPVSELVAPAASVLYPAISASRHRGAHAVTHVPEVIAVILVGALPMAILISAAANCVVALLLGQQWGGAVPVIAVLAAISVLSPVSYVCAAALVAGGAVRRDFYVMAVAAAARCGLVYAASTTGSLVAVSAAAVASVAVEAAMFLQQLSREGRPDFSGVAASLRRLALAGLAAAAALLASGLGWGQALPTALGALGLGAAIGAVGGGVFVTALLGQWRLAGRPRGVETRVMLLLADALAPRAGMAAAGDWLRRLAGPLA
jgi:O-antigen/teichoic acid export membrane protein